MIQQDFDLTIVNKMDVDHGLTVPLSLHVRHSPTAWPCQVIPFAVNVVQYPVPSGRRCFELGQAIRKAVESYDEDAERADLGHRRHEPPVAGAARRPHQPGVGQRVPRPADRRSRRRSSKMPHIDYVREAGSEGIELVMWLIARGAMGDVAGGLPPTVVRRFYHVPASSTAVGHLILEDPR